MILHLHELRPSFYCVGRLYSTDADSPHFPAIFLNEHFRSHYGDPEAIGPGKVRASCLPQAQRKSAQRLRSLPQHRELNGVFGPLKASNGLSARVARRVLRFPLRRMSAPTTEESKHAALSRMSDRPAASKLFNGSFPARTVEGCCWPPFCAEKMLRRASSIRPRARKTCIDQHFEELILVRVVSKDPHAHNRRSCLTIRRAAATVYTGLTNVTGYLS